MDTTWQTENIGKNRGLLNGTIENHECDPQEDCPECRGDGRCVKCDGHGDVDCHVCHGSGRCRDCNGRGKERCDECGGNGRCRVCGGSGKVLCSKCHGEGKVWNGNQRWECSKCGGAGYAPCPECTGFGMKALRFGFGTSANAKGSGKCKKCEGTGELVCKTCHGTGDCQSCGGSGRETCSHCHGSGNCPKCNGTGKITCRRCEGSGWYQTFNVYEAKSYVKKWHYISAEHLEEGMDMADKRPVYKDIYKKWKYRDTVDFDRYEDVRKKTDADFGTSESFNKFEKAYVQASDASKTTDTPYSKSLKIGKVPVTKVDFMLNNNNYSLYILGDNSVVMCDNLPKTIEMYKPSFFQKMKLLLTKKKRHLSYIKLAAYIFQCDGKDMSESHVLNVFYNALNIKPEKKDLLKEQLKKYNSDMPYETFRKEIKSLFSSKKTLTFAWQCMSVDKKISQQENDLFGKIAAEYKLGNDEIESMKKFAAKYSMLSDDSLVNEYIRS